MLVLRNVLIKYTPFLYPQMIGLGGLIFYIINSNYPKKLSVSPVRACIEFFYERSDHCKELVQVPFRKNYAVFFVRIILPFAINLYEGIGVAPVSIRIPLPFFKLKTPNTASLSPLGKSINRCVTTMSSFS